MHAVFVDANPALAAIARRLHGEQAPPFSIGFGRPGLDPQALPGVLGDAEIAVIDHTALPLEVARRCTRLRHVVFLGTGVRSYMDPEALEGLGVSVDIIKGYGDTAVAEHAIGLLFAAARGVAAMDRAMRGGPLVTLFPVEIDAQVMLATDAGQSIRVPVAEISFRSRGAGGVRVFNTAADEHVVSVALIAENGEEEG